MTSLPAHDPAQRSAEIHRVTAETDVRVQLTVDGTGRGEIVTGIGFFDHMLTLFARHGLFDLAVEAKGDLHVDFHHTVEDTGITLGSAFREALGRKTGMTRYGSFYVPMDETLARVVVDFSGRPFVVLRAPEGAERMQIGQFPFQLVEEFLRGFAVAGGLNLHAEILYGKDAHHMAEAIFKGLARAVDAACRLDPRVTGIPSTKGVL